MTAIPQKQTFANTIGNRPLCANRDQQRKQKDRLAAVSPKSDQVF
jgi:hypothetical protein